MADKAAGAKLNIGAGIEAKEVAGITKIGDFSMGEADEIETTVLNNTDGYRTFEQGLKDAGEVELEGFFDEDDIDGQAALQSALENGDTKTFSIAFPTGAEFSFSGFVKSFKLGEFTAEGLITFTATLRMSGKPTFTPSV